MPIRFFSFLACYFMVLGYSVGAQYEGKIMNEQQQIQVMINIICAISPLGEFFRLGQYSMTLAQLVENSQATFLEGEPVREDGKPLCAWRNSGKKSDLWTLCHNGVTFCIHPDSGEVWVHYPGSIAVYQKQWNLEFAVLSEKMAWGMKVTGLV